MFITGYVFTLHTVAIAMIIYSKLSISYSPRTIMKSCVNSGTLDSTTMTSPCLFGIMKAFDLNWTKVPGGENWFMSQLVPCIQDHLSKFV